MTTTDIKTKSGWTAAPEEEHEWEAGLFWGNGLFEGWADKMASGPSIN